MIDERSLRRQAGEEKLDISMLEKDYVLGWILFAISSSSLSSKLAFKGGTALQNLLPQQLETFRRSRFHTA